MVGYTHGKMCQCKKDLPACSGRGEPGCVPHGIADSSADGMLSFRDGRIPRIGTYKVYVRVCLLRFD